MQTLLLHRLQINNNCSHPISDGGVLSHTVTLLPYLPGDKDDSPDPNTAPPQTEQSDGRPPYQSENFVQKYIMGDIQVSFLVIDPELKNLPLTKNKLMCNHFLNFLRKIYLAHEPSVLSIAHSQIYKLRRIPS